MGGKGGLLEARGFSRGSDSKTIDGAHDQPVMHEFRRFFPLKTVPAQGTNASDCYSDISHCSTLQRSTLAYFLQDLAISKVSVRLVDTSMKTTRGYICKDVLYLRAGLELALCATRECYWMVASR